MATLTELYARIALDLGRDDMGPGGELEQARIDAVAAAIEIHAGEPFWFNRASGTIVTVAGIANSDLPAGMRIAQSVALGGEPLHKARLETLEHAWDPASTFTARPRCWGEDGAGIRLVPTPDAAYTLAVHGIADLGVPADANAWTGEGAELILNFAKAILCRGPLRDPDGVTMAWGAAVAELGRLRRETRRRAAAAPTTDLPLATGFDIRFG